MPATSLHVVSSAPLNLTFSPGGVLNDSITLTWVSPQQPNGVVRLYELLQSSSTGNVFVNTTDNTTMVVLSNLAPGTKYNFSVRAFTVAFGPFSDELSVHTADGEDACSIQYVRASHANLFITRSTFVQMLKCLCVVESKEELKPLLCFAIDSFLFS